MKEKSANAHAILCALKNWSRIDQVEFAMVGGPEDGIPTLHLHLCYGVELSDLPLAYRQLTVVWSGRHENGKAFSLQVA
jgi:hypothetical protein